MTDIRSVGTQTMTWSQKRQFTIISVILAIFLILAVIFILPRLKEHPTCLDGKQNQKEVQIDCGGPCEKLCSFQASNISVRWAKALLVTGNFYNALVYIENQNLNAGLKNISYEFKFYDQNNILITERKGSTDVSQGGSSFIFEPAVDMKGFVPYRTTFKFTEEQVFYKENSNISKVFIAAEDKKLRDLDTNPKLQVVLSNESSLDLDNLEVVAILYDTEGNAIGFSKSFVESFPKNKKKKVFFTWLKPFGTEITKIEILSKFNGFLEK